MDDRLPVGLIEGGFDAFAEASCRPYYGPGWARPRCRPGAISGCTWWAFERQRAGLEWRCSDSLSLRASCDWGAVIGYRTIPGCHEADAPAP